MSATSSPMVSDRQVVATPMRAGWYWLATLSRARTRLSLPPNTAAISSKLLEAMSTGSRKWLMR
jgi:hypothetical protein